MIDQRLVQRGPEAALVAHLRATLASAGAALGAVADGRAIGRRGLGRIARIQLQPFLQQRHLLAKLGNLQRLRLDHLMALPQGCWLAKTHLFLGPTIFIKATVHPHSLLSKSSTYNRYFTSSFTSPVRPAWLPMGEGLNTYLCWLLAGTFV